MAEQLQLDLFGESEPSKPSPLEFFLDWAHRTRGCGHEIDAIAERLFDEMPLPFDRGKALVTACGNGRFDQEVVDALGLFDRSLDYHVCWDRAHAARHGIPKHLISKVHTCRHHYRTPSFYDRGGNLIYEVRDGGHDG